MRDLRKTYEDYENIKCDLRTIIVTSRKASATTKQPRAFLDDLRLIFVDFVDVVRLAITCFAYVSCVRCDRGSQVVTVQVEAEKRGLGSCIELKCCRLEKGKDGSKAFVINTQEQWDEERPLLSGNTSTLQGKNL